MDFSEASEDVSAGVSLVSKKILQHGVTSFCPTLVTSPAAVYHKASPFKSSNATWNRCLTNRKMCFYNLWTKICPPVYNNQNETVFQVLPQVKVHDGGAHGAGVLGTMSFLTEQEGICVCVYLYIYNVQGSTWRARSSARRRKEPTPSAS